MLDIPRLLATELSLQPFQVTNALALFAEGATVPFVARYRKERTGEMNEIQLRELSDRFTYLTELEDRKRAILQSIGEQGKLTDALRARIEACLQKHELEDLYLPYKPKRRTRATIARERGLEGLARFIDALNGYVAGLTPTVARNIVAHRNAHGAFRSRKDLAAVPKLGPKTFEQAAGFLRILGGPNPLDSTAVHPERYALVERMAEDLDVRTDEITRIPERLRSVDLRRYVTDGVGEPTLRDIIAELMKPGRDPRAEFRYATFAEGVTEIAHLRPGMELEGVVTNVADFGAFVDIGVHQDGLVHISQLADRFVDDPRSVVRVRQVVSVRVLEVNEAQKRIGLTMKSAASTPRAGGGRRDDQRPLQPRSPHTVDDLMAKFNRKT